MEEWLKNTADKRKFTQLVGTHNLGPNVTMVSKADSFLKHDEADTQTCLCCWFTDTWKANITQQIQMAKWNGSVLNINANVNKLGNKCQGLLAMHALSGCDTVSHPCRKGKVSAVKTL